MNAMSKKHFEALAKAIRELRERHGDNIPAVAVVNAISRVCSDLGPNFKLRLFEQACEPAPVAESEAA